MPSRIRQLYSASVAKELLHLEDDRQDIPIRVQAWCTNANFNLKKAQFICFINGMIHSRWPSFPAEANGDY